MEVLKGILDAAGGRGTLMMYVGWDGSPYDVTIGRSALPTGLAEAWPPYDPGTAHAVRSWGVLAEILRQWPGARRSGHPDSSFAAVGPRAQELVFDHPLQYGMGDPSPLSALCKAAGRVLIMGSPLSNVTLLHHAEHLADVPDKETVRYWAPILRDGAKEWVQIEEYSTEGCLPWFGPGDMFEAILREYLQAGRGAVGQIGAAQSVLLDASDVVRFAVEWIEARYDVPVARALDVTVDAATPSDHQPILTLFERMEDETSGPGTIRGRLAARVDECLESGDRRIFLAKVDDEVVGVLVALYVSNDRGVLEQAFVDPRFRRRGILRELELDACAYLRETGCRTVQVHIASDNAVAREAWRALGYEPSDEFLERPL